MTDKQEKLSEDIQKEWHKFHTELKSQFKNLDRSDLAMIYLIKKIAILADNIEVLNTKIEQSKKRKRWL